MGGPIVSSRCGWSALSSILLIHLCLPIASAAADEPEALLKNWANAFNAGDVDTIVATYLPDATVHGTVSPGLTSGSEAIRAYFAQSARSRTQVSLRDDGVAQAISPGAAVLTGFYDFSGTRADGQAFTAPARYSFVLVRDGERWRIAHHHSSPRPRPPQ